MSVWTELQRHMAPCTNGFPGCWAVEMKRAGPTPKVMDAVPAGALTLSKLTSAHLNVL